MIQNLNHKLKVILTLPFLCIATALCVLSGVLTSCSTTPSGVIPPEKMSQLLADIFTGESVVDNNSRAFKDDSVKTALLVSIYKRHGVDAATVDSSFMWYGKHMDLYTEVYDRTIEILEDRLNKATLAADNLGTGPSVALEGDSVDVWPSIRYLRLTPDMPSEIVPFSLSSDRHWERGDTYTLSFKLNGDEFNPTSVTIAAEYYDGTTDYTRSSLRGEGWKSITLVLDSTRAASNVFGVIAHPMGDDASKVTLIDSISLYRTRWIPGTSSSKRASQSSVKLR
ncbi:MAG: DUF4296 domain-containing protein [Paramuribaculum sp.]|nr:DUF4296 domain-containing protein [Paramuribaculum sp.]MDE7449493.1 DUF4296 domain-containing protein [Paramuribaculum sp.]